MNSNPPSMPRGRPIPPRVLAVASGKGGVGKTWFSITLAHALSRAGRRVLLFDGDLGLANVDVQLGINPPHDLGTVLSGRMDLRGAVFRHPEGGFDILPGRSGSGALAALDRAHLARVVMLLRQASAAWDDVVLDLGAGIERGVRTMSASADTLIVLATDEPTSLTDAYAVMKLYSSDKPGGDLRIVVNQVSDGASGERTYQTLRRAGENFLQRGFPLLGVVRRDEKVKDSIRRQSLLLVRHPNSAAAEDVGAIAAALLRPGVVAG